MYEKHFGFRERPFSLTPDPSFLFRSKKHSAALAMLEYGLTNDAPIVVITGEIGAGKTTVVRQILNQLDARTTVGLITNTHKAFGELIQWVSMAYGLPHEGKDKVALYRAFVDFLIAQYAQGQRTVLIVDEAQNMDADTLEELRLISNINADKNLVLQLVLVGQPELRNTLRQKRLEQFAQRIAVDYHLDPLDLKETREYIRHRLEFAGGSKSIFRPDAIAEIYQHTEGVPRLVNSLCDTALVYTYAEGRRRVSASTIAEMIREKKSRNLFGAGKVNYSEETATGTSEP